MSDEKEDEKIVEMPAAPPTLEERVTHVEENAVTGPSLQPLMNNIGGELEKLGLRLKVLEQRASYEGNEFADKVAEKVLERIGKDLPSKE